MYALALCRRQVVYSPPAHLQADEAEDKEPQAEARLGRRLLVQPAVYVHQIAEPCRGSPGLLGIPRPVSAPCLLGPEGTKQHAYGHEREPYVHQIVY